MADLSKLLKQAQELQANMESAQKELEQIKARGTAGGDLVMATLNGQYGCIDLKLSSALLKETTDVIADTIKAAFNDAVRKVERESRERIAKLTTHFNLPGNHLE